jgi:magnesium chelatase accessory protein
MTPERDSHLSDFHSAAPTGAEHCSAGGVRWRVLRAGTGPTLLLLHGSGATIHSWSRLVPLLSPHFTLLAVDLPGHGETGLPETSRMTLPGVASLVSDLLRELGFDPQLAVGHSAGAAIAARMILDGAIRPRALVGLNPALAAMDAPVPGLLAPIVNRMARSRFVSRVVARFAAQPGRVESTLRATGSRVPESLLQEYRRYASDPGHVNGVLTMMSRWDLKPLVRDLPRLDVPLLLILGEGDRWIAADSLESVTRSVRGARRVVVPGTGHLTHEEDPAAVLGEILSLAREVGVLERANEAPPS